MKKEKNMKYLLSVIIPTKNRAFYCIRAVDQILSLKDNRIQIVIRDNSDTNELEKIIREKSSKTIKYDYRDGIVSFVDNFSEAIALADGEYVLMIGDDDAVLPNVMDAVELAKKESYDAVVPGLNAVYFWPSEQAIVKKSKNGLLCLSFIKNRKREISPNKGLEDLMRTAGQKYQSLDLPRVYHGIVKKEILDEVKERTGRYFGGLTPDIYMATALSFVAKKVCRLYYPITVSGICPRSGSSDSATGKHTGKLKDAPHFKGHKTYEWDKKAPAIYSVESIWAETVLQALKDFKANNYYRKFRVDVLDAICLSKYFQFKDEIYAHAKGFRVRKIHLKIKSICYRFNTFTLKAYHKVFRRKSSVLKYYGVEDIMKAVDLTSQKISEKM